MPHVELYINDELLDLKGDESIEVDYSIFDIEKIGSRGGARSYEFNLPKTNRNKSVLENPEMVNNLSDVPYTRLSCLILVDGVDVLIRFAEVSSVKDSYAIRVYGSNSDLFSLLAANKLIDIDWTDLDEYWDLDTMVAARSRTEGLIYPVIDYHSDSPNFAINNDNRTVRADYLPPSIFVKTVLERIFDFIGYTYTNDVEDDYELIMPLMSCANNEVANAFISEKYEGVFGINSQMYIPYVVPLASAQVFQFDFVTGNTGSYYSLPYTRSNGNRCVTIVDSFFVDVTFSFDVTFSSANPGNPTRNSVAFYVQFWTENNQPLFTQPGFVKTFTNQADGAVNLTFTQRFGVFNLANGNRIFNFEVKIYNGDVLQQEPFYVESSSTITFANVQNLDYTLVYGTTLNIALFMPDMTLADFLKNYMLMFNLIPVLGVDGTSVALKRFDTLLSKLSSAYDWSDKIDESELPEIVFINNKYGQNNYFKYTTDGDEKIPDGTNGFIKIDNKNLELDKDIVDLDFASCNYVKRLVDNVVTQIPMFKEGEISFGLTQRILYLQRKTSTDIGGSMDYAIDGSQTAFNDNIGFGYFLNPENENNLGFGISLLADYYEFLSRVMNRCKIVKLPIRLSAADISQLDTLKPVYIQKYESYFYISKISGFDYTERKSTMVELVKLNING